MRGPQRAGRNGRPATALGLWLTPGPLSLAVGQPTTPSVLYSDLLREGRAEPFGLRSLEQSSEGSGKVGSLLLRQKPQETNLSHGLGMNMEHAKLLPSGCHLRSREHWS